MEEIRTSEVENMLTVLARINNNEDAYKLIQDMFTIREIKDMSQRLEVAEMLTSGKSYSEIEKLTGVSATTIARVSKCLSYGSGGYAIALKLLQEAQ